MRAIVTVIGKDHVGIIADVTALLAQYGVNVLDISQTGAAGVLHDDHARGCVAVHRPVC